MPEGAARRHFAGIENSTLNGTKIQPDKPFDCLCIDVAGLARSLKSVHGFRNGNKKPPFPSACPLAWITWTRKYRDEALIRILDMGDAQVVRHKRARRTFLALINCTQ